MFGYYIDIERPLGGGKLEAQLPGVIMRRVTIKTKLAVTFGVILVMMLAIITVGITKMSSMNSGMVEMVEGPVARQTRNLTIKLGLFDIVRLEKNMALTEDLALKRELDRQSIARFAEMDTLIETAISKTTEQSKPDWVVFASKWSEYKAVNQRIRTLG